MSLEVPIGKNNNIQIFSLNLQRSLHGCSSELKDVYDKTKVIDIQNVLSSNINSALDIIRGKPPFEINTVNYSSDLPTENFTFIHVIDTYVSIIEKITKPAPRFVLDTNDNILIADIVRRAISHEDQNLLDVYLTKYHNVPKAKEEIYNFIYFIRRLPLIRYFLNHYIFHIRPDVFRLIQDNRLDNIEYLLLKEKGIRSANLTEYLKSGIYRFENSYYPESLSYYTDRSFTYETYFDNEFLYNLTGCRRREYKLFNSISLLSETTSNLDNIILLFPFLHNLSELDTIRDLLLVITRIIKEDENFGLVAHAGTYYIHDSKQIKFIITNRLRQLTNNNMNFELGNSIDRLDPIICQIFSLFSYDLLLQKTEIPDNLEDILILLSIFLVNMYSVYVKIEERYQFDQNAITERGFQEANFDDIRREVRVPVNPMIIRSNYIISNVIRNHSSRLVDFYFFSAFYIFRNWNIRTLVKDSIFQLSHLFLAIEFLKKNKHQAKQLFFFGTLSDEKNKWIKSFNRDKNFFLNWAIDYYDSIFKNFKTNVLD